ncbi:MAG: hypothetical protein KDC18_12215, partial [Alphaproteobacteria bacterium]|nr:hypothetical protein [Alphaproteobacteria bacterium]
MVQRFSFTTSLVVLSSVISLAGVTASSALAERVGVSAAVTLIATGTPPGISTREIVMGQDIVYDELIETDSRGQTQVLMVDRTALTIGPNS